MEKQFKWYHYNFMTFIYRSTILLVLSVLLSSCSNLNCTPLERLLGADVNLISLGDKIADELINSAMPPLMPRHPEEAVLTSTFVNIDNYETTSTFSRLLQSHVGARLVQQGYTVKEISLRNTMKIRPTDGEKILSRDLSQITPDQAVQAVMLGTYSLNNRILYITAKLVNPNNRNVIAAKSYRLCMDDNLLAMFGLQRYQKDPNGIDPPSGSIINDIFY